MTGPQLIDCEQNSEAWLQARLGLPTASCFAKVLAKSKELRMRTGYMRKLAGEILTGVPAENYTNANIERGHAMEDEARSLYAFAHEVDPQRVGFVLRPDLRAGCSPDSLLGWDGVLEIKTAFPHIVVEKIEADKFPTEHYSQCQGILWVAEREWIDLVIYWPGMPLFVRRAHRDEGYITKLAGEVDQFNTELLALVERVRAYQTPVPIKQQLQASVLMAG